MQSKTSFKNIFKKQNKKSILYSHPPIGAKTDKLKN